MSVLMPPKGIQFTETERATIIRRYEAGESCVTLGREHYCSETTIRAALKRWGVAIRRAGGSPRKISDEEMEHMKWLYWGLGWTQQEIGDEYGLAASSVGDRFKDFGIPTRSRSECNRRMWAALTPEERTRRARKQWDSMAPEVRKEKIERLAYYSQRRAEALAAAA